MNASQVPFLDQLTVGVDTPGRGEVFSSCGFLFGVHPVGPIQQLKPLVMGGSHSSQFPDYGIQQEYIVCIPESKALILREGSGFQGWWPSQTMEWGQLLWMSV